MKIERPPQLERGSEIEIGLGLDWLVRLEGPLEHFAGHSAQWAAGVDKIGLEVEGDNDNLAPEETRQEECRMA